MKRRGGVCLREREGVEKEKARETRKGEVMGAAASRM